MKNQDDLVYMDQTTHPSSLAVTQHTIELLYYMLNKSRMFGIFFLMISMISSGWGLRTSLKSPLQRTSFTRCHLVSELQQVASESIILSNIDTSSLMQSEVEQQV